MKPDKGQKKTASPRSVRGEGGKPNQCHFTKKVKPPSIPLPDGNMCAVRPTMLQFLSNLAAPATDGRWQLQSLTRSDVADYVKLYNRIRGPINKQIDAQSDDGGAIAPYKGLTVAQFADRYEIVGGGARTFLMVSRKVEAYLEKLTPKDVSGGFCLFDSVRFRALEGAADAGR